MSAAVAVEKAATRAAMRARRDAIPADQRAAAAAAIAARVDAEVLATLPAGAVIALYDAIGSEVATRALADRAVARGLALAYPRVVPGAHRLALHRATPAELRPGTWRIPEPDAATPEISPDLLALIVVPGLAFDRRGARLGWGRGHYDATLGAAPCPRIGLAYDAQLVDHLPTDDHDLFVQIIATEVALLRV